MGPLQYISLKTGVPNANISKCEKEAQQFF